MCLSYLRGKILPPFKTSYQNYLWKNYANNSSKQVIKIARGTTDPGYRGYTYLRFVIFFTPTHFEAWKFYTQKCVNLRQKKASRQNSVNYTLCVKLHSVCKITHSMCNYTLCVKLHTVCKITHCVLNYIFRVELHTVSKNTHWV